MSDTQNRILNWKKGPKDERDFKSVRFLKAPLDLPAEFELDKQIPVFGFGAKPLFMGASKVEHCFPLTGNRENPNCLGVTGIMQKYDKTLMDILFSGPTLFAPVLETFKRQVQ